MSFTKTLVATTAGVAEMETLQIDDAWWLVCTYKDPRRTRPQRVVCLSDLAHEEVKGQSYRFVLSRPLPDDVVRPGARVPGFRVRELS